MFSDSIIDTAKRIGREEAVAEIIQDLENHDDFYCSKTTLSSELVECTEPEILFGYNALKFIQLLLYRSKALIEGSIIALNNKRILTCLLAVRAHFETTGSIAFLLKRLKSYYEGNIDFSRIDDDLLRLSLGAAAIENPDVPKPINVLNMIDTVDDLMNKFVFGGKPPDKKMFRTLYEDLCDFCHPNFQGTTSGADIIHEEKVIVYHKTDHLDDKDLIFFFHLSMSSRLFLHFYATTRNLLEEKETMPIIHGKNRRYPT